jgi:hypothetical protein
MIYALDAPHVAGRDWVQRGYIARMALGVEPCAERRQHCIRATKSGIGGNRDYCIVADQHDGFAGA